MEFQESDTGWRCVPAWVNFLVNFGRNWPNDAGRPRRIALLSMPCNSAAAGLIALGCMIRDLGTPGADDISGHYDALLRHARQYLECCRTCDSCDPEQKKCGYTKQAIGSVRETRLGRSDRYGISERTLSENRLVLFDRDGIKFPSPANCGRFQIVGEPLPQAQNEESALSEDSYAEIISGATLCPENLTKSFSGLCLAGRVAGEQAARETCASIQFKFSHNREDCLANLLTVHGWSPSGRVSRMSFLNTRTENFDRNHYSPALVVADGDAAFLKVLGGDRFQQSDVIGVISRTIERDNLEAVGNHMLSQRQWYEEDVELRQRLPPTPRGVAVLLLKRRA